MPILERKTTLRDIKDLGRSMGRTFFSPIGLREYASNGTLNRIATSGVKLLGEAVASGGVTILEGSPLLGTSIFIAGAGVTAFGSESTTELDHRFQNPVVISRISSEAPPSIRPDFEITTAFAESVKDAISPDVVRPVMARSFDSVLVDGEEQRMRSIVVGVKQQRRAEEYTVDVMDTVLVDDPLSIEAVLRTTSDRVTRKVLANWVKSHREVQLVFDKGITLRVDRLSRRDGSHNEARFKGVLEVLIMDPKTRREMGRIRPLDTFSKVRGEFEVTKSDLQETIDLAQSARDKHDKITSAL